MHPVMHVSRPLLRLLAVLALAAGLSGMNAVRAAASGGGTGGCNPYVDGTVIPVPCFSGSESGSSGGSGTGGSGGGGATAFSSCTTIELDEAQAVNLGLSWSALKGQSWALQYCLGGTAGPAAQAVLVNNATGTPAVTPRQLLVTALGELHVPHLNPSTAPPRGHDGLVGLPEWFWIAAGSWYARTVTVTAGPVWASVTAAPVSLTLQPGVGLSPVSCNGPGTAYNPHEQAAAQHTDCSYTYLTSSAGLHGNAYQASVTVTWKVSWIGSGGAGGVVDAALSVPVGFRIPVAQGEALVTSP
jgi:hypothetical protein